MGQGTRLIGMAAAALLALAAAPAAAQQQPESRVPADGVSDVGAFEQVPYRLEPQMALRAEDRMALRKLEDKHIGELRGLEDRYEKDLRSLRAKQQAERDAMLKSFAARR
jgi:hypothetical protein